ncbi:hypothetical protein, partial [Rhodonellum ikkaensis]|uniref:hypothetical protein n=1 Tax=Rhodonellum ikkaensis TaxID=336829 RepID=UPI001C31BBA0
GGASSPIILRPNKSSESRCNLYNIPECAVNKNGQWISGIVIFRLLSPIPRLPSFSQKPIKLPQ